MPWTIVGAGSVVVIERHTTTRYVQGISELSADTTITCPRCGAESTVRFYGPCDACRDLLRAEQRVDARQVDVAEYEPKMNVTPNAVATKDD